MDLSLCIADSEGFSIGTNAILEASLPLLLLFLASPFSFLSFAFLFSPLECFSGSTCFRRGGSGTSGGTSSVDRELSLLLLVFLLNRDSGLRGTSGTGGFLSLLLLLLFLSFDLELVDTMSSAKRTVWFDGCDWWGSILLSAYLSSRMSSDGGASGTQGGIPSGGSEVGSEGFSKLWFDSGSGTVWKSMMRSYV